MTVTGGNPADAMLGIHGFTDAQEIGRGSFGAVYRAHQPAVGRDVAIKILTVGSGGSSERFDRERNVLGALSGHPAIVTVFDSGYTQAGQPYVVMELMGGGSLGERLVSSGPLPWQQGVETGVRVAGGLEVAHRMGVLHRDVKPDNLLVSNYGDVKLADFGVATFVGGASSRTWSVIASVAFAAPEVLGGQRSTVASDVYGLASTVFALLGGHAPFSRSTDDSVLPMVTRILTDRPPDLRVLGVPNAVCLVLERAMEKDPGARYPSAQAFGAALQDAQRALGVRVTTMVIDPNLTSMPPHDVVTALAQPVTSEDVPPPPVAAVPPAASVAPPVAAPPPPPVAPPVVLPPPPPPPVAPPVASPPPPPRPVAPAGEERSPWAPTTASPAKRETEADKPGTGAPGVGTAAAAAAGAFAIGAAASEIDSPWAPASKPDKPATPPMPAATPPPLAETSTAIATPSKIADAPPPPPPATSAAAPPPPPPPPPAATTPPPPPPPPPSSGGATAPSSAKPAEPAPKTEPVPSLAPSAAAAATAATAAAASTDATKVFDAGPVLADMVTGRGRADQKKRSRGRTIAGVAAAAVLVLGTGAASYAVVSHNKSSDSKHANAPAPTTVATLAPTTLTTATTLPATTEPPTTLPPATVPATTAPTSPPPTQATVAPPPPPPPAPTVSLSGPTSIEDNVAVVYHASTTNATSGQWSLTGGPAVNLHSTAWHPGTGFGFSAGCNAVGATYTLTLHANGPGGSNSGSISFRVHDANGSCR